MQKIARTISLVAATLTLLLPAASVFASSNYQTTTVTYPYYGFVENPENPWSSVWDALDSTGTIEYSDDFFTVPSPGDHPELRALSYALALAGYENKADGYPSTETTPNPKLTNLLDQMGFSDYESWDLSSEEDGHSMGTTIANKTLASGQDLIVIAPRNYNYMTEWLSNFNVGISGDHAGFTESANLIVNRLNQYLSTRNLSDYKIWIVGYSRGGAVVDLAAKNINEHIANYDMSSDDFYAYTFGAPRASITETKYTNIHDVKDGNDLLLGYVFPEIWGFYNTGIYEEIHPADLTITASVIDLTDLSDSSKVVQILFNNEGVTQDVGTINGRTFMDNWIDFVNTNGLTREYFDTEVKPPLSALMKAYQLRTIDKQSDFTNFIKDTSNGMLGRIAGNAFMDLMAGGYGETIEEAIANFPVYQELIRILRGTASDADIDDLLAHLTSYIGEYSDYTSPTITEEEFTVIKENLPKLIKALSPLIIADARYTTETYDDNYTLYYTYTLISNAETLVIGHIPESIMPILKSLIPKADDLPLIPDTGIITNELNSAHKKADSFFLVQVITTLAIAPVVYLARNRFLRKTR
jgi:hypothetical protein